MQNSDMHQRKAVEEVFRRIGRNIANFQALERALKSLLPTLSVEGAGSKIQPNKKLHEKALRKQSLGSLADTLHETIFQKPTEQSLEGPLDQDEGPRFQFGFYREASPDYVRAFKRRWNSLVRERNNLVHRQLSEYDLTQDAECERFCIYLEQQDGRINMMAEDLKSLDSHRVMLSKSFAEFLMSKDADKFFETDEDDA